MYLLYSILYGVGVALLLPWLLYKAARHGRYAAGFLARARGLPRFDAGGRPVVWLHCVSVGEALAARPLARALAEEYPGHALVVSTTTVTGQEVAREAFARQAAQVFYFPFDWAWSVRRALRAVDPSAVLLMETELWPRFFRECRRRGVPLALVNGRISEKSFGRYKLIRFVLRRVLSALSLAAMQTEADASRLVALGLPPERARVTGNVKFDIEEAGARPLTEGLRERFGLRDDRPLVVAASTHAPEERVALEAFKLLQDGARRPRLLVAPRKTDRFGEVAGLLEASGLTWARRTAAPRESDRDCDVILLDSIGELRAVYPLAEAVFVGGSIARHGGQNVLEPAADARAVVTGPHTSNFKAIVAALLEREALVQLPDEQDPQAAAGRLARVLRELLEDDGGRRRMGERARAVLEENRGATARTLELLAPLLHQTSDAARRLPAKEKTLASDP